MTKLTKASYTKIALISIFGVLLLGLVGFGTMRGCTTYLGGGTEMGSASIDASNIKNINIDWAAGSVDVVVVNDSSTTIELVESAPRGMTKSQQMRWSTSGNTLSVDYGRAWSCFSITQKRLEVRIPAQYAKTLGNVSINGASGYYHLSGIGCDTLKLKLASGEIEADNLIATKLDVDVASGQTRVGGTFTDSVSTKVASGQVSVTCYEVAPKQVDANLASGQVYLAVPESTGFTAQVDKASGNFSSAFETSQQGNVYTHGDGSTTIHVRLASGQFNVEKTRG